MALEVLKPKHSFERNFPDKSKKPDLKIAYERKDKIGFEDIINEREKMYDKDMMSFENSLRKNNDEQEKKSSEEEIEGMITAKKAEREVLSNHLKVADLYRSELVSKIPDLTKEELVLSKIGVDLHDSGKLSSILIEHGERSAEYIRNLLDGYKGKVIDGVKITPEVIDIVANAALRHMNHPHLIELNSGKHFPKPETNVDKIVNDVDMISNVGFKNVGFRLNQGAMNIDAKESVKKGISVLEEAFSNVMKGVRRLKEYVYTDAAKEMIGELIEQAEKIYCHLKDNLIIAEVQNKHSKNGEFDKECIRDKTNLDKLKEDLNLEIYSAGMKLNIPEEILGRFLI